MADESVKQLLEQLSKQFLEMKTELSDKSDAMKKSFEDKNKELDAKLEATNKQLTEVRQSITSKSQTNTTDLSTSGAVSQSTNTSSNVSAPTNTTASSTSSSATDEPTAGFSGNLMNHQATGNSVPTGIPYTNFTSQFPIRKHLVALTPFDGNPCDWLVFSADYKRTTIEYKYSSSENTTRLNDSLKGKARDLVRWLLIHDDMAEKIMERLQTRFGRPEMLVDAQVKMLRDIRDISDSNIEQVVPFADAVINFSHFMLSSASQHHLANPTLLNELISKLPMSMKINWASHLNTTLGVPTILDFSNWIEMQADNIARVTDCGSITLLKEKKVTSKRGQMFHASSTTNGNRCIYRKCEKDHLLVNCPEFLKVSTDDKWAFVREKRLCFTCLKDGHSTRACPKRKSCGKNGCIRVHNPILHNEQKRSENIETTLVATDTVVNCHAASKENIPRVLFKMLPVKLYHGNEVVSTFAMIDEGSSVSLINRSLAQRIGLSGPKRRLNLQWFGDHSSSEECDVVKFQLSGVHSTAELFELSNVCTVSDLCLPMQTLEVDKLHSKFTYLRNLPIVSYEDARPEILIGLDYCHLGLSRRTVRHASNGPIVAESPLGWIAYGRTSDCQTDTNPVRMFFANESLDELNVIVRDYFTTENFGVQQPSLPRETAEERRAMYLLKSTTKRIDKRYESGLLWRTENIVLPDSYQMAVSRLRSIENKMAKDPMYATKYKQAIASYIDKGYARRLSTSEATETTARTWYLPHFGVLNPNKPDKFRLVFDAAALVEGVSLNSALLTGPDLNQPLLTVLSKFREGRFAVCGDIKEMYLQILIIQQDQHSQRFLWRNEQTGDLEIYKMLSMTFGSTSSPTTAQFVKNFHATQHLYSHREAAEAIMYKHYVDDYVNSFKGEEEAIEVTKMVKQILLTGGFDLRGFISNSRTITSALNTEIAEQTEHVNMDLEKSSSSDKILGMVWDTSTDQFRFQLKFHRIDSKVLTCQRVPTKREFLAIVMSVYDPFGFLADFLIFMKVLLQSVWRSGIDWDQPLPMHLHELWRSWNEALKNVSNFRVPRCLDVELWSAKSLEFHTFVDSSEVAFSAVCYLRIISQEGNIRVSFIIGKTRCAPVKFLSIPRLELQAALLGVRLFNTVTKSQSFCVKKSTFWSDSKTVLHWIKDDRKKYKTFVANRVSEILDSTNAGQWKWISTRHNPADDATRDKYPPVFNIKRRWIDGPEWLHEYESDWPQQPVFQVNDDDLELHPMKHTVLVNTQSNRLQFDFARVSSYFKILRAVGWITRYATNLKAKSSKTLPTSGELTVKEITKAENAIFRNVQMEMYHEEYNLLSQDKPISKGSKLNQLTPVLDDYGVIRLNGRIDNAPTLPLMTKRPIILPKHHPLTTLIVRHYHESCRHQNEELIICEIRRKFWVSDLRVLVRAAKRQCQHCKNESARPQTPQMGQLPIDRLTPYIRPFTFSGLDYFGPVYVTIGRRREKRWVALFTCLTMHLELAADLSTDACIMCLRNFTNLRGIPKRIRSDNGSNFIGARNEILTIGDVYNKDPIITESTMRGIEWRFNCPSNPSAGGCWERLVRSIKSVLKQTLKEVAPKVETLRSYLIEAANIVNSRPLTHVPVTSVEEEPLTPNTFLLGIPNSIQSLEVEDQKLWTYRKQWRIANALKNHFWRRWVKEFLPTLTRRTKWFVKKEAIKVGDLVIVCDEDVPRKQWIRGIVENVFPGQDGQVRRADIRTSGRVLQRPASKLAVLDVESKSSQDQELIYGAQDVVEC